MAVTPRAGPLRLTVAVLVVSTFALVLQHRAVVPVERLGQYDIRQMRQTSVQGATLARADKIIDHAAMTERRAIRQERQAEIGMAKEAALAKAFRAQRLEARTRLVSALKALNTESNVGLMARPVTRKINADQILREDINRLEGEVKNQARRAKAHATRVAASLQSRLDDKEAKLAKNRKPTQEHVVGNIAETGGVRVQMEPRVDAVRSGVGAKHQAKGVRARARARAKHVLANNQRQVDVAEENPARKYDDRSPRTRDSVSRVHLLKDAARPMNSAVATKVLMDVATAQTVLAEVKQELAQDFRTSNAHSTTNRYERADLPHFEHTDRKHCTPPLVWDNGECKGSPRGRRETAREEGRLCGQGRDNSFACQEFRKQEREKLKRYENDLRRQVPYNYHAMNHQQHAGYDRRAAGFSKPNIGSVAWDLQKETDDHKSDKELDDLERSLSNIDDWIEDTEPNRFVTQPQRYPHRDGADLGDNYLGVSLSDKHGDDLTDAMNEDQIVPVDEQTMKEAPIETFLFGHPEEEKMPMFASEHVDKHDADVLKKDRSQLKYANDDDAMGKKSPLDKQAQALLYGSGRGYIKNKYGFPADTFPSKQQLQDQVNPPVTPAEYGTIVGRHDRSEVSTGILNGKQDPFGFTQAFADDSEPMDKVRDLKFLHRKTDPSGEPLSDWLVSGNDMTNMNSYRAAGK